MSDAWDRVVDLAIDVGHSIADQRDDYRDQLDAARREVERYRLAWESARRRAKGV